MQHACGGWELATAHGRAATALSTRDGPRNYPDYHVYPDYPDYPVDYSVYLDYPDYLDYPF
jgi:hypothetical protein